MPVSNSDAVGKPESFQEQMDKFQGFAVKDGEVFNGKQQSEEDIRNAAEAKEKAVGEVNQRSHAENVAKGSTSTEGAKSAESEEVKLTEDEEEAALQALVAKGRNPDSLTQAEMHKAIDDALKAKQAAAEAAKAKAEGKTKQQRNAERYDENYKARRAAERRADDLQRQIDEIKAGNATPLTKEKNPSKEGELSAPNPADPKYQYGELDAKYLADLARFETLKAIEEDRKSQGTRQQTAAETQAVAELKARVTNWAEEAEANYPDFQEVVMDTLKLPPTDPDAWPLSPTLGELILESDFGHQIAYDLASDPKEARRVAKLSVGRQAIWFGQKEAEISAGSAAKATETTGASAVKTVARESKAPIPLRTRLNGSGGNRVPNSATTDFAAFEALTRQKRMN